MAEIREIELLHTISEDETDKEGNGLTGVTNPKAQAAAAQEIEQRRLPETAVTPENSITAVLSAKRVSSAINPQSDE